MRQCLLTFLPVLCWPTIAFAQDAARGKEPVPMPDAIRSMLQTAIASGNETDIASVAKVARQTVPGAAAEIDALVNAHREDLEVQRLERVTRAGFTQLWTGRGELGGFRSTGSTTEIGISAGISLTRTGVKWSHSLTGSADYRRANGETSRERFVAAYQPRYQFDEEGFAYALAQFERDPILGFSSRLTSSAGIGYKLIHDKKMDLSVDIGPSLRHVEYIDATSQTRLGGRSSVDFAWRISPTLTFRQNGSGYVEDNLRSLNAQTSLESKVLSRLSASFSYNIQFETETPISDEKLDTLSKVTLVYDF
jgi:putative salt-induced outer membrane protein